MISKQQRLGTWLYDHQKLAWLYESELRKQLPFLYQFFARYCQLQKPLKRHRIKGAEFLLRQIINLSKALGHNKYVKLDIDGKTIFLNLWDPRMLNVPNDFRNNCLKNLVSNSLLSEGDTFIDVGANYGIYSIIAAQIVGTQGLVIAIEPQPQLATLVQKSLEANAKCQYQLYEIACGEEEGSIDLYIPEATSASASIFPGLIISSKHQKLSVPLKRFDDLIDWHNLKGKTFIKLDIEGSELAFLRGATTMIRKLQPHIMLEIQPKNMEMAKVSPDTLIQQIQELGYTEFIEMDGSQTIISLNEIDFSRQHDITVLSPKLKLI